MMVEAESLGAGLATVRQLEGLAMSDDQDPEKGWCVKANEWLGREKKLEDSQSVSWIWNSENEKVDSEMVL